MIRALMFALALTQSATAAVAGDTTRHVTAGATTVTISTTAADTVAHGAGRVDSTVAVVPITGTDTAGTRHVSTLPAVKLPSALIAPSPLPAWILYGVVGLLLALVLVLAAHRAVGAERFGVWLVHPFTGTDGRLSFSKLICVGVLVHYAISANMPAVVACWIIAASFGTKVLLAVVEKTGLSVSSATSLAGAFSRTESDAEQRSSATSDSKSDTRVVSEQITRTIQEERGPTGEPPRSLPPTGATAPDGAQ